MNTKDEKRIHDIVAEAHRALAFAQGKTREDLETDTMFAYAVTHCLLIIGEAASKVSAETRQRHPQIQWRNMVGMRNRIVHDYGHVDLVIVWNTVEDILSDLIKQLEQILPQE